MSHRPRTAKEYVDQVDQLVFDLKDLQGALAYDTEAIDVNFSYLDVLIEEVHRLRKSMEDGSYRFGKEDLPFMPIVKRRSEHDLPFIKSFYLINQTHKEGLDTRDE